MRIQILGSAAGGGFPQWNCGCRNCQGLRAGTLRAKERTQTQVAISDDGQDWFLLNASPDLRLQIERTAVLRARNLRHSPITGVLMTSADIDHVAGLLSLRELHPFRIYCTRSLSHILRENNSMFGMLNRVAQQVCWNDVNLGEKFALLTASGCESGISCETVSVGATYPPYVAADRAAELNPKEASLGLILTASSDKRLAYFPAVPMIDDSLLEVLNSADLLLFDGTFWSDDELIQIQGSALASRDMGHVPVGGDKGTLRALASLRCSRKLFVHVNNTNPMLDESGPEYQEIQGAGWELAEDGWQLEL
jgi:pyrroloquinoline quinone biosynthesis protein B